MQNIFCEESPYWKENLKTPNGLGKLQILMRDNFWHNFLINDPASSSDSEHFRFYILQRVQTNFSIGFINT